MSDMVAGGLRAGALAAGMSLATAMAAGRQERGHAWEPVNAIAHMGLGDNMTVRRGFDPVQSSLGLAGHVSALLGWGIAFNALTSGLDRRARPAAAAAFTAAAALVDYRIVPKRFTPGFERVLSSCGVLAIYVAMAAALVVEPLLDPNGREP